MKLNRKYRAALFTLAILCVGIPAQAQDKPEAVIANPPVGDKPRAAIVNPEIDMGGFLRVSQEAANHRETRRITEEEFILMSLDPGTIILDARSSEMYKLLHVKGAINLSFPDIAIESVKNTIPDKDTRILIYCNNNFRGARKAFASKSPELSLNISTYIALYSYGYRNVYELGPLIDISESRLQFETTIPRDLWSKMEITGVLRLEAMKPLKQE
jgi:rhodanese-related sulfurtransferase